MWRDRSTIFRDPPVELSAGQLRSQLESARRAARQAQLSLTLTKRALYRRYRLEAGDKYLDWPRWKAEYLREYNRRIKLDPPNGGINISS